MKFQTIGIIVKPRSEAVKNTLEHLLGYLKTKNCTVILDESADGLSQLDRVSREQLGNQSDLAITIGGDGTMLNAARSLADKNVPLVGINIGRLGFLADVSPADIDPVLDNVLNGD